MNNATVTNLRTVTPEEAEENRRHGAALTLTAASRLEALECIMPETTAPRPVTPEEAEKNRRHGAALTAAAAQRLEKDLAQRNSRTCTAQDGALAESKS